MEGSLLFNTNYLLACLVFGILTGFVATLKNRSGIGWFLWGLIFGVFAFIVILLKRKLPDKVQMQR